MLMKPYIDLVREVLETGEPRTDRTGTGTLSLFGRSMRFDLSGPGFPLLTHKKLFPHIVVAELVFFIRGERNTKYLKDRGVHIWDEWANDSGDLGRIYGVQWRRWAKERGLFSDNFDQLAQVVEDLRHNRDSRRIILTAWNPGELKQMALPPCHMMVQFYVDGGRRLHAQMYQRSADLFIGVPYNIAEYALFVHLLARITGLLPGSLTHVIGDAHLYRNYLDQVREMLSRAPSPEPRLRIRKELFDLSDLEKLEPDDVEFEGYAPHKYIKAPVAV